MIVMVQSKIWIIVTVCYSLEINEVRIIFCSRHKLEMYIFDETVMHVFEFVKVNDLF